MLSFCGFNSSLIRHLCLPFWASFFHFSSNNTSFWIQDKTSNKTPFFPKLFSPPYFISPLLTLSSHHFLYLSQSKKSFCAVLWYADILIIAPSPSCHEHHHQLFPARWLAPNLTALRFLSSTSSSLPPFCLQTDNPLIHQMLLHSAETGRALFRAVISPEVKNLHTHTRRAAFLSPDRQTAGR